MIGTEIEEDILAGRVPLCKVCNSKNGDGVNDPKIPKEQPRASKKKRKNGRWDDDESEEDEPDLPDYPPGIMKVFLPLHSTRGTADKPSLDGPPSPTLLSSGRNSQTTSTVR